MPQTERPDEIEAKTIIEAELGVVFHHADTNGGVDFTFETPDGATGAAEITTVTDESLKKSNDAWMKLRQRQQPTTVLRNCWTVTVHQDRAVDNGLVAALTPALVAMGSAGIERCREHEMVDLMGPMGTEVREAGRLLRSRAVVEARRPAELRSCMRFAALALPAAPAAVWPAAQVHGADFAPVGSDEPVPPGDSVRFR